MSIKGNTESSQSAPEAPKRMSVEASGVFAHEARPANVSGAIYLKQIVEAMHPLPLVPPLETVLDELELLQRQAHHQVSQELQDA